MILFFSFLHSSLILSKIKTFASTAIPTVKIIPAIPGSVSVASKSVSMPIKRNKLSNNVILAIKPKTLYLKNIKIITSKKPIGNGIITCLNMKQAKARKKKGAEAAKAVISVISQK